MTDLKISKKDMGEAQEKEPFHITGKYRHVWLVEVITGFIIQSLF